MVGIAMGCRNAGISQTTNACRDARHDTKRNARSNQGQGFFTAAPEDKGVATLQSQDAFAGARQSDQAIRDIRLLGRGFAAALAGIDQLGFRCGKGQDGVVDQRVIDHDISLRERMMRKQGQQTGVAGAGTNQPDPAGFKHGKVRQTAMT